MRIALLALLVTLAASPSWGQSHTTHGGASSGTTATSNDVRNLEPAGLAAMLGKANVFIYDCNEEDMFREAHVPGAKLTVYDEVTAAQLPTDLSATLIFYCYSPECPAATTAARTALTLGHTDVYSMLAGITGWQDAGLPTEP